ncbi:MAG: ABC-F family ATP-binding cassette domain-containing protein [Phycisphaerales bacterium]|nr:ABC-F family ATP-binding cassette domain-containing protein [Phycisphaerales bacterium]
MPLLAATNITFSIGQELILRGVSLSVEPGQRIGMVGRNGGGKTTLMKILAGQRKPDTGELILQRGARAGYLAQDPDLDLDETLLGEAHKAFAVLEQLHRDLDGVFHEMETAGSDSAVLDRLLKRQADLERLIDAAGGYAVGHRVEEVLHGLGFEDSQFGLQVRKLSGGQKGRLALAKLLLEGPDLVLLDEPTNHLDIAGREWLEEFLVKEFRGAVIMVSHDRYMLDRVVHEIVEVEEGRLIDYPGNYSAFRELRAQRRLSQFRAYENQQVKFRQEEAYIRKYKAGQRAKQAQGRLSKLTREKRDSTLERPIELVTMRLQLPKATRSGDLVAVVRSAGKSYAAHVSELESVAQPADKPRQKVLFTDLTVTVSRGDRWAIIGPNGAGKTTLVRALLGQLPLDTGSAKLGASLVIGYYSQLADEADPAATVWEYLQQVIKRENPGSLLSEQSARDLAGAFLFTGSDQEKPLGVLSGGERSRARLAGLLASSKNLLVLDEPTNHLDISSAERLEDALQLPDPEDPDTAGGYEGTLILISHDRALIDATCDHLIILDGHGNAVVFNGTYSEWHQKQIDDKAAATREAADTERRRNDALRKKARELERSSKPQPAAPSAPPPRQPMASASVGKAQTANKRRPVGRGQPASKGQPNEKAKGGLSWMPMDRLEVEIERVASRLGAVEELLAKEEVYRDQQRFDGLLKEQSALTVEQQRFEEEWLRRAE